MSTEALLDDEINKLLSSAQPCASQTFEDILDFIDQRSITYRMFRNEFAPPGKFQKNRGNPDGSPKKFPKPKGVMPFAMYYVPLPSNRSLFSIDEMNDLFAVFTATEGCAISASQILTYSKSLEKLKAENTEFLSVVKQRWSEDQWSRTSVVKDYVANFIATWWKNRIPRVSAYPPTYKQLCPISLTPQSYDVKLKFMNTLFSYGRPPRYWSNPHVRKTFETQSAQVVKEMADNELFYEQIASQSSSTPDFCTKPKAVSQDPVAEQLAKENQALVVMTPSVLATLLGNNPVTYEESWSIPFVIKEYELDVKKDAPGDHTRKMIFFDKKLAPESLTARDKNRIYAKYAVRTIYLRYSSYWNKQEKAEKQNKAKCEPEEEEEEEEEEDWPNDSMGNLEKEEDPLPLRQNRMYQAQVHYNLWECSAADESSVLSKHHKKPFKLLIRTPIRGQFIEGIKSNPDGDLKQFRSCTMLPKLDYQPEYGAQLASFSEITKEWVHAMLRPNSAIHRVRVDPVQGNTIMIEQKSTVDLASDCIRLHNRPIQNQVAILQNLVDSLGGLPPGNYLLNHQVRDQGFMFVYHEQKDQPNMCSKTLLSPKERYSRVNVSENASQTAPWVPIDTGVITPTFFTLRRVPCVFAPSKSENKKRKFISHEPPDKRSKKKKNKSKNKKQASNKKKEATIDAAAAASSQSRKRVPYEDLDSVNDDG